MNFKKKLEAINWTFVSIGYSTKTKQTIIIKQKKMEDILLETEQQFFLTFETSIESPNIFLNWEEEEQNSLFLDQNYSSPPKSLEEQLYSSNGAFETQTLSSESEEEEQNSLNSSLCESLDQSHDQSHDQNSLFLEQNSFLLEQNSLNSSPCESSESPCETEEEKDQGYQEFLNNFLKQMESEKTIEATDLETTESETPKEESTIEAKEAGEVSKFRKRSLSDFLFEKENEEEIGAPLLKKNKIL